MSDVSETPEGRLRNTASGKFVTKFDVSIGQTVVELSRKGYTLEAIAGHLGVSRKTLYRWTVEHPEFAELCEVAKGMRQFSWEKTLIEAPSGPAVQAASLALRAMDLKNFNDKKQVEVKVETNHTLNLDQMSPDQIKQLMSIVQAQQPKQIEDAEYEEVPE